MLLALGLNSWREGRANHGLAVRALHGLVDEAKDNCELIQAVHPYHEEVASGQRQPEGIRVGMIRNDAWPSARSTGAAAYVDYDVAVVIGRIYASQSDHRAYVESYAQAMFTTLGGGVSLPDVHGDLDVAVIREIVRIQAQLLEIVTKISNEVPHSVGFAVQVTGSVRRRRTGETLGRAGGNL